jgi:hypothetical protein
VLELLHFTALPSSDGNEKNTFLLQERSLFAGHVYIVSITVREENDDVIDAWTIAKCTSENLIRWKDTDLMLVHLISLMNYIKDNEKNYMELSWSRLIRTLAWSVETLGRERNYLGFAFILGL